LYRMEGSAMRSPRVYWSILFLMAPLVVSVATLWHRMFELPFLLKKVRVVVPPDTARRPVPVRPAYAAVGGAPVPQRQMHAFAFGSEIEPGRDGLALSSDTVAPISRAGFLPRKSKRVKSAVKG
jgi:hypothetical protein